MSPTALDALLREVILFIVFPFIFFLLILNIFSISNQLDVHETHEKARIEEQLILQMQSPPSLDSDLTSPTKK